MRWCIKLVTVITLSNLVEYSLAQPQIHNVGLPLPPTTQQVTAASSPVQTHHEHHLGHGVHAGVPLPPAPEGTEHSVLGAGGVPLPSVTFPSSVSVSHGGVPLPSPTSGSTFATGLPLPQHPLRIVPTQQGHGVPLPPPPPAVIRGLGSPSFPVGVPLPPPTGVPGAPPLGAPPVVEGVAAVKRVKNVDRDIDVQNAINHPAVYNYVQLKTKADRAVKITDVISAHKQIVSGQVLFLTVHVGETKCPIGIPDLHNCVVDLTEDDHVCEVALWNRPWLNSSKVIIEKSRCAETEESNDFNRWGPNVLLPVPSSAQVSVQALPQGVEEQQVGVEAFNYIDRGSESKFRGEMIAYDLTSIKFDPLTDTTQMQVDVEYGFTLCLRSRDQLTDTRECPPDARRDHYICSVVVVHNPNQITSLEVIPILDDDDDIHCERKRNVEELVGPVSVPCPGCPHPTPLNDPHILEVADFALKEYDKYASDEDNLHVILQIMKAYSQVVGKVIYFLTMELAESQCKKTLIGADVDRSFCRQDPTEETKICEMHVAEQPSLPAKDLLGVRCYDRDNYLSSSHDDLIVPLSMGGTFATPQTDATLGLLGSESHLNVDDKSMSIVKFVVDEYNHREDDDEYYKLVRVIEVTSQAHGQNGRAHHIVAELGETKCRKTDPSIGEHCPLDPTEDHEVCEADVLEDQSLQNHQSLRILTLRCDDLDDYLRKKFMPVLSPSQVMNNPFMDVAADTTAGYKSVATNDSAVLHAAFFVAEQFNLREDEDEIYTLNKVVSSRSQPSPNGITYHLEVELAETHCKKYQFVAAPSRCPVDHSEEMEVCQAEVMVPQSPEGTMQLLKLYCDEMNDYYTRRIRGTPTDGGVWMDVSVDDVALKKLGHLIANEYDLRSDESSLFIFHKVLKARKQVASGIQYQLVVELLETVCPKYKRRINKARCAPDIGEDHVVCEAHVFSQPWLNMDEISHFRCAEKDEFFAGHESVEVFYPKVHPSAHARPVFKSHFVVRTSDESDESNERFYQLFGRTNSHRGDTDEDDSDERRPTRGRRAILGSPSGNGLPQSLVRELADFAVHSLDHNSSDIYTNGVKEILHADMQEVSGNLILELLVHSTTCVKNQQDLSLCSEDNTKPIHQCKFIIVKDPELDGYVVDTMLCQPQETHPLLIDRLI